MFSFLIVDDEPIIRKGIKVMLERSTLHIGQIKEAGNGQEALERLQNQTFHFVITDIRMPKMDGLKLCQSIQQEWPEVVTILATGYDDFAYAQEAIRYGVKEYILKPISPTLLISSIQKNMEAMNNRVENHISYSDYESMICAIESGLWNNSAREITEGYENLCQTIQSLSLPVVQRTLQEITETIVKKISVRIGQPLTGSYTLEGTQTSHQAHTQWFLNTMQSIQQEIVERKASADYNLIQLAKQYIEDNYNKEVSLEYVAKQVGLNPSYFSQLFKAKTGQTFVQYRSEVRMLKAMEFLCCPEKTVTEIAFDVGYQDITHFIRKFKKHTGHSPTAYRSKNGIGV